MNKKFKKAISLILCLLLTMSIAVPAAVAANHPYPVVYLEGYGDTLYASDNSRANGTEIYPTGADVGAIIKEALLPCLKELAGGLITDNYDRYCDELYNAVAPIYKDLVLDKNGEASDGSGDGYKPASASEATIYKNYDANLSGYRFPYDWRLSPWDIADELYAYIEKVKATTKSDKVTLVGRCLGGNMVSAYLAKYTDHAAESIDTVVMYVSSSKGINMLSSLFAGEIVLDENYIERFADFLLDYKGELISDPDIKSLVDTLLPFLNEIKVLGLGMDALQYIVDQVKDELVPRIALACYGSFPGYWAMVTEEKYIEARDFIFKGIEDEYAGMIEKLDTYYENVQLTMDETMDTLENAGVKFGIFAKYNVPSIPVYAAGDEQADFFTGIKEASFGATAAKLDKELSDSYINSLSETDKKYLSPDHKVDASTCRFRDTTWFIKDNAHAAFPDCIDDLMAAFINSKGTMTIFDDPNYPQFLQYKEEGTLESITPVAGLDPEVPEKGSSENRFAVFIRFFTTILNFFKKLFSGDFKNLFG